MKNLLLPALLGFTALTAAHAQSAQTRQVPAVARGPKNTIPTSYFLLSTPLYHSSRKATAG